MNARLPLLSVAFALLCLAAYAGTGEKSAETPAEMKVRLRLIVIESSVLSERYGSLFERELSLQGSVRACIKSGDERLPQYQAALAEAQADLVQTKKKLAALESEKTKLVERLGVKDAASVEQMERVNGVLQKILERLDKLDKRLDKLGKDR